MPSNFKNKKLLILGAMEMHVPLIERANALGIYTITCDYYADVPGHKIAKEAHVVSTTDLTAVLKLAKDAKVDGIMTYNSDPAAVTAAYVSEKLGLPGNSYKSVKIMSEKDLFRDFLKNNNLNVPHFIEFRLSDVINTDIFKGMSMPLIVKPVDSSGSKGVSVIGNIKDLKEKCKNAFKYSRCKRIIVEEYIESLGSQLHGDGFIKDGKLIFLCLGDHHFDSTINNLVPYSTTYPTQHSNEVIEKAHQEIQHFITQVGFMNGGINVELRVSEKDGKIFIIDIGARNGGNFTPKVIEYATGFNFLDAVLEVSLGGEVTSKRTVKETNFVSYLILHSKHDGVLKSIELNPLLKEKIIEEHIYKKPGDKINTFIGANAAIGVLILRYKSMNEMDEIVENFESLYKIKL